MVETSGFGGQPVASHFLAQTAASDTQGQFGRIRSWWDHGAKREQGDKRGAKAQAGFENVPNERKRRIFRENSSTKGKLLNQISTRHV